jgi:hypothetical protein
MEEATPNEEQTQILEPRAMAYILFGSGMEEDRVLDAIKLVGDNTGYTPQLNECGKEYLAMCHEAQSVGRQQVLDKLAKEFGVWKK